MLHSEGALIRLAASLGAADSGGPLTAAEARALQQALDLPAPAESVVLATRDAIAAGEDPLGQAFYSLRDAATRRSDGAVYTPKAIVAPMVEWTLDQKVERVVDAGAGSGRFLGEVLRRAPHVDTVAVDTDPVATIMTRAMLAALKVRNAQVIQADYTNLRLPALVGRTAFIGNPPYVRHHLLSQESKAWAQAAAASLGVRTSGLAGLHVYFFLATAINAQRGDVGCFVTASEWLDVNYGAVVRSLFVGSLGGKSLHVIEPRALPFDGTQTTAVISTFEVGATESSIRLQNVDSSDALKDLATSGHAVTREQLARSPRWTAFLRRSETAPEGYIELGELCRVHRGAVTGANDIWVLRDRPDLPESVMFPSITRARELFDAGPVLSDDQHLRVVVDLPSDLDELELDDARKVLDFIARAKQAGGDKGYIATHRRAWWSIGLNEPAPILATYMARRPPTFVVNAATVRHINIAHGLYPRDPIDARTLTRLAEALRLGVTSDQGRTYAGGLVKFEPKEMERLMIPSLEILSGQEALPITRQRI